MCENTKAEVKPEEKKESSDDLAVKTLCVDGASKVAFDKLVSMHTYMRPHGSKTERKFIHDFLQPHGMRRDGFGNLYKVVGEAPILWSSHTDTVHKKKGIQVVGFDKMEIGIADSDKNDANCLGADDTVGVWLMLEMIEAKVPGLYIFHRDEESGRKGSQFIAKQHKGTLEGIKFAVALDRRDKDNFITHQSGLRCCSDDFADSFIAQLQANSLTYKKDDTGSFTDTHSYVDIIGECTNISVGYKSAHSKWERLDLGHAFALRNALCKIDVKSLVEKRKPGEIERKTYYYSGHNHGGTTYYGGDGGSDFEGYDENNWVLDEATGVWRMKPKEERTDTYDSRFNEGYYDQRGQFHRFNRGNTGTASGKRIGEGVKNSTSLTTVHNGNGHKVTEQNSELRRMFGGGTDQGRKSPEAIKVETDDDIAPEFDTDFDGMVKLVQRNPEAVADILETYGVDAKALRDEIIETVGVCNF